MDIVNHYLAGLRQVLPPTPLARLAVAGGASAAQLQTLLQAFPACPASLLALLSQLNGTHWDDDEDGVGTAVLVLGADPGMGSYPYFLRSVEQILEDRQLYPDSIVEIYGELADDDSVVLDSGIDAQARGKERLCFAHCINNGGTSMLYLDFAPGSGGVAGQVIRFVHDPDEYRVIAASFDDYLQLQINQEYAFVDPEQ
jgi:hypothetical protein